MAAKKPRRKMTAAQKIAHDRKLNAERQRRFIERQRAADAAVEAARIEMLALGDIEIEIELDDGTII